MVFSPEGLKQVKEQIAYYLQNAQIIADTLQELGIWFVGGKNSPYIWLKCPDAMKSWEFFDYLLTRAGIVGTPGVGFGPGGEGYFRLSAFGDRDNILKAMKKLRSL